MDENREDSVETVLAEDSTEALLEEYDRRRRSRSDDSAAMQTVLCIVIAAALFAANMKFPDRTRALIDKARELSCDESELMPNLIDLLISFL